MGAAVYLCWPCGAASMITMAVLVWAFSIVLLAGIAALGRNLRHWLVLVRGDCSRKPACFVFWFEALKNFSFDGELGPTFNILARVAGIRVCFSNFLFCSAVSAALVAVLGQWNARRYAALL